MNLDQRRGQLLSMPKAELVRLHIANGGLMPRTQYFAWRKDELVTAVLEDEGFKPFQPQITARHCPLCGTFHDELKACPELVPGYPDSADGRADLADQIRWSRREGQL